MTLDALERPAEGEPAGTLVLIHGRGADEHDLYPLLDALDPERRLRGLTPGGPLALPPGGRHWYALGGIPTPEPETFWPSFEALSAFLDGLQEPIVLGGFSQGAVMSHALAFGRGAAGRPAALLPLSGFMPEVEGLELDLTDLAGYPVGDRARNARPGDRRLLEPRRPRCPHGRRSGRDLPRGAAPTHDRPRVRPGAARIRRVGDRRLKVRLGLHLAGDGASGVDAVASFHGEFNGREGSVDHAQTARRDRPHRCRLLQRRGLGTARHLPQDGEGALRRPSAEARRPPPAPTADRVPEPHRRRPSRTGPRPLRVGELTAARPRLPWGRGRAYRPKRDTFRAGFVAPVTRRWARPPQPSRKRGAAELSSAPA